MAWLQLGSSTLNDTMCCKYKYQCIMYICVLSSRQNLLSDKVSLWAYCWQSSNRWIKCENKTSQLLGQFLDKYILEPCMSTVVLEMTLLLSGLIIHCVSSMLEAQSLKLPTCPLATFDTTSNLLSPNLINGQRAKQGAKSAVHELKLITLITWQNHFADTMSKILSTNMGGSARCSHTPHNRFSWRAADLACCSAHCPAMKLWPIQLSLPRLLLLNGRVALRIKHPFW